MAAQRKLAAENLDPNTKAVIDALLVELSALRTAHAALLTKLDADTGVTGTDYGATCAVATATIIR